MKAIDEILINITVGPSDAKVAETNSIFEKYFKLTNLNNSWVITKRHNGNTFFKRKAYITCLKNFPDTSCIWTDETKVKEEVNSLNSVRKKCKYSYQNASKYFVNNYTWNSWQGQTITNKALSIKNVKPQTQLGSVNEIKKAILARFETNIQSNKSNIEEWKRKLPLRLADITKEYEDRIYCLNKEYEDRIDCLNKDLLKYQDQTKELLSLNHEELLKPYETQGDRMVKVLFSNKPEVVETIEAAETDHEPF